MPWRPSLTIVKPAVIATAPIGQNREDAMNLNAPLQLEYMAILEGLSTDDPRFGDELRYIHKLIRVSLRSGLLTQVEAIPLIEKMIALNNSTLSNKRH